MLAVAVSFALLVAASAATSGHDQVEQVEVLTIPHLWEAPIFFEGPVEIEIVEYGFGLIEHNDRERLTVGAVVRNPHPTEFADVVLEVVPAGDDQASGPREAFRVHSIAPGSDALVGRMLTTGFAESAEAELELTVDEAYVWEPLVPESLAGSEIYVEDEAHLDERFTVIGNQPLLAPDGHRVVYQVESDLERGLRTRVDVVFRDAQGNIVGGVGGSDHPIDGSDGNGSIMMPPGTSVHHFNLVQGEIPRGADLDQTEIGPGGVIPGG